MATKYREGWDYSIWLIKRVEFEGKWYWGWFNGAGEEYGDLNDLCAEKYLTMPLLK
jgi:hypothetical protein